MSIVIEYRPIASLRAYGRKLRRYDPHVPRMVDLIREFGFRIPLLIRGNGEIIDGGLRLEAAKRLELTEVPVVNCDDLTQTQIKALRLAVNRSASWADWDLNLVAQELFELKALDFNLNLTAFDRFEIDSLLTSGLGSTAESVPEPLPQAITRPGELWRCGAHRVLCGDSTSKDQVTRVLNSVVPFLMVTDPPYGVELDPQWRERAGLGEQRQTGLVANDDRVDWTAAYELFPGDVAYVWHAGVHEAEVAAGLMAAGFDIRSQIIWVKQHFALSRGDYHWQHEPCLYAVRRGKSSNWCGDRKQSTVWEVRNLNPFGGDRQEEATGHGTQKPVELMRRPMDNHTQAGDTVYDPFLGSGTSLMAAEITGRICYGLDIDPRYVDVAILRWQKHTGKTAVLDSDGRSFAEIQTERSVARKEA